MIDIHALNPEQRLAATTINGPVLILAGAGTGKTRVITCRIAYMVHKGVDPSQILAVTFTNKAAREMQQRIKELIPSPKRKSKSKGDPPAKPVIGTFHSLCVRILRRHIEPLGYRKNFVIYNQSDQIGVVRKILSHIHDKEGKPDPNMTLALISQLKNGKARAIEQDNESLGRHVLQIYQASLKACNAVDFDDLILLALQLFQEYPEVLEECRSRYRYVMVDEYQDTNGSQFNLVHALAKDHRNLCVVGDDDQSIYGWRGAEIANLLNLERYYPEVKVVKLEQNYRSTNVILKAANAVICHNTMRKGKNLWSQKGEGERIRLKIFEHEEAEAEAVVDAIEFARMAHRIGWGDQAILFRTNHQARPLESALRKAKVRYNLVGGQSFFDRREIKDFLSYLKVLINPNDDNSLLRIANVPARGISLATQEKLLAVSQTRKCSVFQAMQGIEYEDDFSKRAVASVKAFVDLIQDQQALLKDADSGLPRNPAEWADGFMQEIGYYDEVRRGEKESEQADHRIRGLRDFMEAMAQGHPSTGLTSLESFLDQITLDTESAEEKELQNNAVTLITMHSCKGLEFPHVHIVGVEEGNLPHARSKLEGTIDEERRLFYVGITRAQRTLCISHCSARKKYGQLVPAHPSRFLTELPEDLILVDEGGVGEVVPVNSSKNLFASMRDAIGE